MHLSLPHKTASTHHAKRPRPPMSNTGALLCLYVLIFSICVLLSGCASSPKPAQPVDVGLVVQPDKVQAGALPTVVAETLPLPAGHFQTRRLERETLRLKPTMTPSLPTASTSPTLPVGATR